jgi:spermidine/putrescine-binding protein
MNIKRLALFLFASLLFILLMLGCSKKSDGIGKGQSIQQKRLEGGELILYNWEEYIGSKTLKNFKKETGISVTEIFFEDEEEMLGAVQSDLAAYDLVVTSDDTIREMREAKMLTQLDMTQIPNIKNVDEKYLHTPWDPEQMYSVPYMWGTTGMVVNKKYIKEDWDSWSVLFDQRYSGKIAMLNNPFEVSAAACKMLGLSINTYDQNDFEQVRDILIQQKPMIRGYLDALKSQELIIGGELWAAQIYSGEGLVAADENNDLVYVIPREGAAVWVDSFVMPRDAQHREEAHIFLNYILSPDVNAAIASEFWYATTNREAVPLMDPEVVESPSVYPPDEVMARTEFFIDIGEASNMYNKLWAELMRLE